MTKKSTLKYSFVSMLLTLTIALSGCSGDKEAEDSTNQASTTTGAAASEITIGITQDLNGLDPSTAKGSGTQEILFNIYEGLYKPDSQGNLIPAVASGYTLSEDKLTYTFTLREGVMFHNGNPVTVEDVKYTFEKCAGNTTGEALVSAFSNMVSCEILDEQTIAVTLAEPNDDFLAILSTTEAAIVPDEVEDLETNPVGTGPYKFVSRSLQDNIVLEKFDEYWGEPANIENVTIKVLADAEALAVNLNGGAVDLVSRISTSTASALSDDYEVLEGTTNLVQAMYLNNAVEPFNNEKVRQALSYAINKEEILAFVADGKGTPVASSMFPAFSKYYMDELNDTYTTDTEKAKALLTEAGYPDGFTFTIKAPSNYQTHVDTATVIAEQLKQIGVTANIELIEWETWLSDVYADRNYEATVVGVDASNLTAGAMFSRFETTAHNNFCNYSNEAYDTALANARNAATDEEATEYYKECETILCQTAANVYICDPAMLVAINKNYGGFTFYPLYILDIAKLYIK